MGSSQLSLMHSPSADPHDLVLGKHLEIPEAQGILLRQESHKADYVGPRHNHTVLKVLPAHMEASRVPSDTSFGEVSMHVVAAKSLTELAFFVSGKPERELHCYVTSEVDPSAGVG
ncbi:hypothetical protein SAMN02745674_02165 [Lysobacter spongiicola DSM 21749]|uniref:Uncharacterized protein n=1 Tax=Lysobacter spongiicola DSM 21749 TaxID=1122188 RepID=A0A1T4RFQ4_9GAMM|nr:hypothetical protein SAMN02745674_02165 [Lysobacter spongiicola DSM 21749]